MREGKIMGRQVIRRLDGLGSRGHDAVVELLINLSTWAWVRGQRY